MTSLIVNECDNRPLAKKITVS